MTRWHRRLGLGSLWLRLYHQPIGRIREIVRQGGPLAVRETERQRREMEAAAATLPQLPVPAAESPLCLHLLTGRRFWYQTAFCVHSFVRSAGEAVRVELYDDGSLAGEPADKLQALGPAVRLHMQAEILERLNRHLPEARYPVLRDRRHHLVIMRKLTDIHAGTSGWKLLIDSDLLFFRRPSLLLDWMRSPSDMLHALDCVESYGYDRTLMGKLAGAPIPGLVNSGLCGLRGNHLDWDELEAWCAELIAREGPHYYLEQALVAMLAARRPARTIAPAADYVTWPSPAEVHAPRAVMHHYVADSKRGYFREGWRHVPR